MKRMPLLLVLAVGLLAANQAMAQSKLGLRSVGASIGFVSPENVDGTFGFGVFADVGRITPVIGLEPVIEYWSKSDNAFGAKASLRDVSVGARGKYYIDTSNPKLLTFVGAGLGLHFLHSEGSVTAPGFPTITVDASDTKLGLDFGGGIATPISPKDEFHAEAWFGFVSDVNQFAVRAGISHAIGK